MIIQVIIEIEMRHGWPFVVALRRKAAAVEHADDRLLLAKPLTKNVATKPPTTIKLGAGDHSDQGHRRGRGCVFSHNARAAADGSIAKALGLEVPHNLLVLADKVIE